MAKEQGTKENPRALKTPPFSSEFTIYKDIKDGKEMLVSTVGKAISHYNYRCLANLPAMLKNHNDRMELASIDEQKPVKAGTAKIRGRSEQKLVGGWYGLKKGLRGKFAMCVPPLMEKLGLAELTHDAKENKMRVK